MADCDQQRGSRYRPDRLGRGPPVTLSRTPRHNWSRRFPIDRMEGLASHRERGLASLGRRQPTSLNAVASLMLSNSLAHGPIRISSLSLLTHVEADNSGDIEVVQFHSVHTVPGHDLQL